MMRGTPARGCVRFVEMIGKQGRVTRARVSSSAYVIKICMNLAIKNIDLMYSSDIQAKQQYGGGSLHRKKGTVSEGAERSQQNIVAMKESVESEFAGTENEIDIMDFHSLYCKNLGKLNESIAKKRRKMIAQNVRNIFHWRMCDERMRDGEEHLIKKKHKRISGEGRSKSASNESLSSPASSLEPLLDDAQVTQHRAEALEAEMEASEKAARGQVHNILPQAELIGRVTVGYWQDSCGNPVVFSPSEQFSSRHDSDIVQKILMSLRCSEIFVNFWLRVAEPMSKKKITKNEFFAGLALLKNPGYSSEFGNLFKFGWKEADESAVDEHGDTNMNVDQTEIVARTGFRQIVEEFRQKDSKLQLNYWKLMKPKTSKIYWRGQMTKMDRMWSRFILLPEESFANRDTDSWKNFCEEFLPVVNDLKSAIVHEYLDSVCCLLFLNILFFISDILCFFFLVFSFFVVLFLLFSFFVVFSDVLGCFFVLFWFVLICMR